jgi:hypothetical protein
MQDLQTFKNWMILSISESNIKKISKIDEKNHFSDEIRF